MSQKLSIEDLAVGTVMETTFWANPVEESGFRFRGTHLDGKRAPKVVLCDDPRVRPGVPALVKIIQIKRPERDDRGAIVVELVRHQEFKLEGVYVEPTIAKKLQVLLESGQNILLDGLQGCGKTVLTRTIAKNLGYEFVFFNCCAVVEAADFLATLHLRADDKGSPITDFVRTDILKCLEDAHEHSSRRYLVFLDEFNRCPEPARNALMPALDSTRKLFHPIRNTFIDIPDNVLFVAAVNRGQQFGHALVHLPKRSSVPLGVAVAVERVELDQVAKHQSVGLLEPFAERLAHSYGEAGLELVVQEAVDLEDAAAQIAALGQNARLEFLHAPSMQSARAKKA